MLEPSTDSRAASPDTPPRGRWMKVGVVVAFAIAAIGLFSVFGESLTLERLAERESSLRETQEHHPAPTLGVAFLIYVLVTGLSIPGATVLSLFYGWFFGFLPGLILVSFASTAGATVAMLTSRYLFRDAIQRRFGNRLDRFNESLKRDGPFFLFTLRLIPVVPFFVVNAVMGLTPIRVRTFWWVSQLGMLAGTAVYLYAGSRVPSLQLLAEEGVGAAFSSQQLTQLFIAFSLLGIFPLIARWGLTRYSKSKTKT